MTMQVSVPNCFLLSPVPCLFFITQGASSQDPGNKEKLLKSDWNHEKGVLSSGEFCNPHKYMREGKSPR